MEVVRLDLVEGTTTSTIRLSKWCNDAPLTIYIQIFHNVLVRKRIGYGSAVFYIEVFLISVFNIKYVDTYSEVENFKGEV